jgi:serine/threonine protein kinase
MSTNQDATPGREQRFYEILGDYYAAAESGPEPDRQAFVAQHTEFAADLREFFDGQDRIAQLATPLRPTPVRGLGQDDGLSDRRSEGEDGPGLVRAGGPDAEVASDRRDSGPAPNSFGRYQIVRPIGRGGMGVVFEARQAGLNRRVALKVLVGGPLASADDLARFRNEAEAVAGLDHPNIIPVYEVGEHRGFAFFSMKLAEGGSLAAHRDRYRADPRAAARLLARVARGVHYAHQRGVLHRDFKPSNVLLDAGGTPYIADFGLAKRPAGGTDVTPSRVIVGTPAYMAPEQAMGRRGAITTATDVHGLWAVLYAMLTGRPPFGTDSVPEVLEQVMHRPPERRRALARGVGRDLETICLTCLEKEPARRYASAEALADDLERWLEGEPIAARPVGRAGLVIRQPLIDRLESRPQPVSLMLQPWIDG